MRDRRKMAPGVLEHPGLIGAGSPDRSPTIRYETPKFLAAS